MKLSEYIKRRIIDSSWTYADAAEYYNVSPTTINGTVNGKFDVPTDTLLKKYAEKDGYDIEKFSRMLSYLPVKEENMNASNRVMKIIKDFDKPEFSSEFVSFFTQNLKSFCIEVLANYTENSIVFCNDYVQIPEDSLVPILVTESILHSSAMYTLPDSFVAYFPFSDEEDMEESIDSIQTGNIIMWGFAWMEHDSIGRVILSTCQMIDRILMYAFRCPLYKRFYIIFKDKQEYEYAIHEYLNSIKFPPFQVYFVYYQDPNTILETKIFDYPDDQVIYVDN